MTTMKRRGDTARIGFDERDNMFVGRVLGLRTMISFHGETVKDVRKQLAVALDEVLRDCEQHGVRPEKPASGRILLRIPPEVHGAGLVAAQAAGTSLNQRAAEVIEGAAHS